MTEKQGGSDVRANVTEATPTSVDGEYTLHGHKWFTSAPMNDVFLVLAQADGGVTCFLVPRVLPDGSRNRLDVVRLKDKLGNRSNASAELELDGTWAQRLGDEGRGVRTIIEMVAATRLDCVLGSASLMRRAAGRGVVARRPPLGVRLAARRQAADAERRSPTSRSSPRRRPRSRMRLAAAVDDARRPARGRAAPDRAAAREVLGLQAHAGDGRRGAGVPGRQRLRRGVRAAAALPRVAAQLDLGGLGQRQRPRRAARARPASPRRCNAWITEVGLARGADPRLDRADRRRARAARRHSAPSRSAPAGWPGGWRPASRARCWCASPRPRSPTRSAPRASARRTTAPSARSTRGDLRAIVDRTTPRCDRGDSVTPQRRASNPLSGRAPAVRVASSSSTARKVR